MNGWSGPAAAGPGSAHRWKTVGLAVLAVASTAWFFQQIGKELAPDQDEGRFIVRIRTPLGSSIHYTDSKLKEVEQILFAHKEIVTEFAVIGLGTVGQVNQGLVVARMVSKRERTVSQQQLLPKLRQELSQIAGARVFPAPLPIVGGQRGEKLQFVVRGPNLMEMGRLAEALQHKLAQEPTLGRMDLDLQLNLPQIVLQPDRTRAAAAGLSSREVALALNMLTGGVDIAKYNDEPGDGERYDIRVKAGEGEFMQRADLTKIYLRSKGGQLIRLDGVASFNETIGPAVIGRLDLQYAATFYGTPSIPLGDAVDKVRQAAQELLPLGYSVKFLGQAEELDKTERYIVFTFSLALVLLYMVLASQFNSFLQALIIMVAQPLAIIGGMEALWLTGHTLNIYSMIGLTLLIGLVAKNPSCWWTTNQRRASGLGVEQAPRPCYHMRPVSNFGLLILARPAALGAGAETNGPLAVAVVGGMISSTLLTLVVVPAIYSLVEAGRERVKRLFLPPSQTS